MSDLSDPRAREFTAGAFIWRLEVAVWTRERRGEVTTHYLPRLSLVRQPDFDDEERTVFGFIELDVGGKVSGPTKWMAYHYPTAGERIGPLVDEQGRFRDRDVLGAGEVREPRDTPRDAINRLLEMVEDEIPSLTTPH